MRNPILEDPVAFRDALLSEATPTHFEVRYEPVVRVLLYYIWRGATQTRASSLQGAAPPANSLIAMSAYIALLPFIQLTRLGYHADAIVLARSLLERIALVGYLDVNRDLIPQSMAKGKSLYKAALAWAKRNSLRNWMQLYGVFSRVAHSHVEGLAGHIMNRSPIGYALRDIPLSQPKPPPDLTPELLAMAVYALIALDPVALSLVGQTDTQPFPYDSTMVLAIGLEDTEAFVHYLQDLVSSYSKPSEV